MTENEHAQFTCSREFEMKLNEPPKKIIFRFSDKELVEFSENGIVFNHDGFPGFTPNDFAREFIDIMEKNFCIKFLVKMDSERGYLRDHITVEKSDLPTDTPS